MSNKSDEITNSQGGIKEIREIIFGETITNLQKQINDLKNENVELKEKLATHEMNINDSANLISDLTSKLGESNIDVKELSEFVDSIKLDLEEKLKELKFSKIDKNQIGQAFIDWGTKVKSENNA